MAQEQLKPGKLRSEHVLYIRSMGKALQVTAWFVNDDDANRYMESHSEEGVVAVLNGLILLANLYDKGTPIPR